VPGIGHGNLVSEFVVLVAVERLLSILLLLSVEFSWDDL
jgi:hypothetical protein